MSQTKQDCDVIVIGAGHNGLVAANYLADAGLDVIVLEGDAQVGGMTGSSCSIPEAPEHLINHCAVDPIYWSAFPPAKELELERYGLRMLPADPAYAYLHPDGASLAFWKDPRRTADEIRHFSRSDAEAYLEFTRFLDAYFDFALPLSTTNPTRPDAKTLLKVGRAALRHRKDLGELAYFGLAPALEIVNERFTHPIVRNALLCITGVMMPNSHPSSAMCFLSLCFFHRIGSVRPIGGTQAMPNALTARLQARGGSVRVSSAVAGIKVKGGRATGVELEDGTELTARKAILAACHPKAVLQQMLPPGTLSTTMETRVKNIPSDQMGYGMLKVDVALSGRLDLSRFTKQRQDGLDLREPSHFIGTEEGIERAFNRSAAGLLPYEDDWCGWNCIPTAMDPSQAPAGQDTLYLYINVAPGSPEDGWKNIREQAGQSVINHMATFYGGLSDLELGRQVQCNEDVAERRRTPGGHIMHVDFSLSRTGPVRPARGLGGYKTPVEGLFMGASGVHPGGGVTGAPGYNGAQAVLRSLRRKGK